MTDTPKIIVADPATVAPAVAVVAPVVAPTLDTAVVTPAAQPTVAKI